MRTRILLLFSLLSLSVSAQVKVLFDATKAETAGNADWVVDADLYNLGTNSSGAMVTGAGNEANPQRYPTGAQSNITSTTSETYWKGALSSWGVDLAKRGYVIETLPYNGQITYGVSTNPQDLSNYKIFVVDEPNIRFTSAQKTAILNFVKNGGGLMMIADHTVSDRNNDGWDSPAIWNDLMTNNGSVSNPFGISFDLQNFSQTSSNMVSASTSTLLNGAAGTVTGLVYNNGTTMTLNRTANSTAKGLIFKTGYSTTGTTQVMFATSQYGAGKVCAFGDSSPMDDGTGDTNDQLYSSYSTAASGSHRKLLINAIIWLSNTSLNRMEKEEVSFSQESVTIFPNPATEQVSIAISSASASSHVVLFDLTGKILQEKDVLLNDGIGLVEMPLNGIEKGLYFISLINESGKTTQRLIIQ